MYPFCYSGLRRRQKKKDEGRGDAAALTLPSSWPTSGPTLRELVEISWDFQPQLISTISLDERSDFQERRDPIDRVPRGVGRPGTCRLRGVFSFSVVTTSTPPHRGRDQSGPYARQCNNPTHTQTDSPLDARTVVR